MDFCLTFIIAQTPTPGLTLGQSSPPPRLASDPVSFYCSFIYPTATFSSSALTYINLYFKFTTSSTSSTSDTIAVTISWNSPKASNTYSTQTLSTYSSRLTVAAVSDSGASKNYSITLSTYTMSDVGNYYYCQLSDSTGTSGNPYSSLVQLQGYCMFITSLQNEEQYM